MANTNISQSVLDDFIETYSNNPNASDDELFEVFPEFGNNTSLLASAKDYHKTRKDNPDVDLATVNAEFPEFFGGDNTTTTTATTIEESAAVEEPKPKKESVKEHNAAVDASTLPLSEADIANESRISELEKTDSAWNDENPELDKLKANRPEYLKKQAENFGEVQQNVLIAAIQNTDYGKQGYADYESIVQAKKESLDKREQADFAELQEAVNSGSMTADEANNELKRRHDSYEKMLNKTANEAYQKFATMVFEKNKNYLEKENRRLGNNLIDTQLTSLHEEIDALRAENIAAEEEKRSKSSVWEKMLGAIQTADNAQNEQIHKAYSDNLALASMYLQDAQKIKDAATEGKGFGGGFGDAATDVDTWDFGIGQMMRTARFKSIIDKLEKNNGDESVLTKDEKILMQAGYTYLEACALNSSRLSRAYKAGQTTGESIPFMIEFGLGFASAAENAVAKGVAKFGEKMFGKVAEETFRHATRQTIARIVGTATGAALQTAMFGIPKIVEGSLSRQLGQVNVDIDFDNNQFKFGGIEEGSQQSGWDATKNSILDNYIENLSEMFFTQFNPLTHYVGQWLGATKMFQALGAKNWVRGLLKAYNNPVFRGIRERMQFGGYISEVMEEEMGGLLRFLCSDVNTLKEAGLDMDSQIDTFLGLLPTSMFFLGVGGVSAVHNGIKTKYNLDNLLKSVSSDTEREFFKTIIKESTTSGEFGDKAYDYIRGVVNDNELSPEDKQARLAFVADKYYDALSRDAKAAADKIAEENYGESMANFASSILHKDGNSYGTVDTNGNPVFITDGDFTVKEEDGNKTLVIPRGKTVTGVYVREDGTMSDPVTFKAKDLHHAVDVQSGEMLRGLAKAAARSRYAGNDTFEFDGKTYSSYTLEETEKEEEPKESEPKQTTAEQKPIQKTIYVDGAKGKKIPATVIYNGDKIVYNEDGTIDEKNSEGLILRDYKGKEVTGKKREAWFEALNNILREERAQARANLEAHMNEQVQKAKKAQEAADVKKAVAEARRKRAKELLDGLNEKEGWIDAKKSTPEQIFWYTMTKVSLDDAFNEAVEQCIEDVLEVAKLRSEEGKTMFPKAQERNAEIHKREARVKAYEDAIAFWVDETDNAHNVPAFRTKLNEGVRKAAGLIEQTPVQEPVVEQQPQKLVVEQPKQEEKQEKKEPKAEKKEEPQGEKLTARSNAIYDHIKVTEEEIDGVKYTVYTPYVKAEGSEDTVPVENAGVFVNSNTVRSDEVNKYKNDIADIQVLRVHEGKLSEGDETRLLADVIYTYKDGHSSSDMNVVLKEMPKISKSYREKKESPLAPPNPPAANKRKTPKQVTLSVNPFSEDVALVKEANGKVNFVPRAEIKENQTEVPKRVVYALEGGTSVPYIIRSAKESFGLNSVVSVVGEDGVVRSIYANQLFSDTERTPFVEENKKLKVTNLKQVVDLPIYTDRNKRVYTLADLLEAHPTESGEISGYEYIKQIVEAENPEDKEALARFHGDIKMVVNSWNLLAKTLLNEKGYDAKKLLAYRYMRYNSARSAAYRRDKLSVEDRIKQARSYDRMMDGPVSFDVGSYSNENLAGRGLNNPLYRIACMIEICRDMEGVKGVAFDVELPEDIANGLEKNIITPKEIEKYREEYKALKAKKNKSSEELGRMSAIEVEYPEVNTTWVPLTREVGEKGYEDVKNLYKIESGEKKANRARSKEQQELDDFDELCMKAVDAFKEGDDETFNSLSEQIGQKVQEHAGDNVNKFANRLRRFQNGINAIYAAAYPDVIKLAKLHKWLDTTMAAPEQRKKKVEDLQGKLDKVNAELANSELDNKRKEQLLARKDKLEEQLANAIAESKKSVEGNIAKLQEQLASYIAEHPEAEQKYQEVAQRNFPENGLRIEFQTGDEAPMSEFTEEEKQSKQARLAYNALVTALQNIKGLNVRFLGSQRNARKLVADYELIKSLAEFATRSKVATLNAQKATKLSANDEQKPLQWSQGATIGANQATAISAKSAAKVLKKLETTKQKLEKSDKKIPKGFISSLARDLGMIETGDSHYVTIELQNGTIVKLRLSNHNATVSNFDNAGESEGLSIVISNYHSHGITNDGSAHIVEYFYEKSKIKDGYGTPLADIVGALQEFIQTGEFNDVTGLAYREEVNIPEFITEGNPEYLKKQDGTIYGISAGKYLYLTDEGLNPETPIHEYTHIWLKALKAGNKAAYDKVLKSIKARKALWDKVAKDPAYAHLHTDEEIASEVLARYSGKRGAKRLMEVANELYGQNPEAEPNTLTKTFISKMQSILQEFWDAVKGMFGIKSMDDISDWVLKDLFDGKPLDFNTEEMKAIKEKAIADGTFMKTPNGEQSLLSEKQWLQVRTKAFKSWYGDWENPKEGEFFLLDGNQYVWDEKSQKYTFVLKGEPMIVYHGTTVAGFDIMDPKDEELDENGEIVERSNGRGIFMTQQQWVAGAYAEVVGLDVDNAEALIGDAPHSGIYSLYANIKNPLIIDCSDHEGNPSRYWNIPFGVYKISGPNMDTLYFDSYAEAEQWMNDNGFGIFEDADELGEPTIIPVVYSTDEFVDLARKRGYDGVIFKNIIDGSDSEILAGDSQFMTPHDVIVALVPEQVKSATQNKGLFSMADARIEFQHTVDSMTKYGKKAKKRLSDGIKDSTAALIDTSKPLDERASFAHRAIMRMLDRTEGLRLIQQSIDAYREALGLEAMPSEFDVRTKFDSANAAAMNKIREMKATKEAELREAVDELAEIVAKSDFYKEHMQEQPNVKNPTKLTPIEFIGRYLIARNNWERAEDEKERGTEEFKQRMGMDMIQFADEFHKAYDKAIITNMWDKIKQLTDYTLDTIYEGGMITKEEYERLKAKDYYVPQRGFWDRVNPDRDEQEGAEDFMVRISKKGKAMNKLTFMHKAEGGKSLAENPLVYIYSDISEAIVKSELNKVKRTMFDLLRENSEWCNLPEINIQVPTQVSYRVNEDGKIEKVINGISAEEREEIREMDRKITEYQKKMSSATEEEKEALREMIQELEEKRDEIAPEFSAADTRAYFKKNKTRNSVGILIDGYQCEIVLPETFALTADALNGVEDQEGKLAAVKTASSFLAAQFTVNNPAFFAVNLVRDVGFVTLKGATEYGIMFTARFYKNLAACQGQLNKYLWTKKMPEAVDGKIAEYLVEFLNNGANTGLMNNLDLAKFRYDVQKMNPEYKKGWSKAGNITKKTAQWIALQPVANYLNEWSELTSRFAIYAAMRDSGYDEVQSTNAAHNLSVNFNRRGLGSQFLNLFSSMTVFVNATIQGTTGLWRAFGGDRKHPVKKALKAAGVMAMGPALLGFLNTLLLPDDDDDELVITPWDRDNYICLPGGIRIPLAQEIRPFWCMGVNIALMIKGKRSGAEVTNSVLTSLFTNGLPLPQNITNAMSLMVNNWTTDEYHNIGEIGRTLLTPTFLETLGQLAEHKNFMGGRLRYDMDDIPEYEMAPNESAAAKDIAYAIYLIGGGDKEVPSKTKVDDEGNIESLPGWADINPKEIRNFLFMFPSGTLDAWLTVWGIAHDIKDAIDGDYEFGKNVRAKDIPVANRFYHANNPGLYRYGIAKEAQGVVEKWEKAMNGADKVITRFEALSDATGGELSEGQKNRAEAAEKRYDILASQELMWELKSELETYKDISISRRKKDLNLMSDDELRAVYGVKSAEEFDELEKEHAANLRLLLNQIKGIDTSEQDPNRLQIVEE